MTSTNPILIVVFVVPIEHLLFEQAWGFSKRVQDVRTVVA